jgi:hypothetical protein
MKLQIKMIQIGFVTYGVAIICNIKTLLVFWYCDFAWLCNNATTTARKLVGQTLVKQKWSTVSSKQVYSSKL